VGCPLWHSAAQAAEPDAVASHSRPGKGGHVPCTHISLRGGSWRGPATTHQFCYTARL